MNIWKNPLLPPNLKLSEMCWMYSTNACNTVQKQVQFATENSKSKTAMKLMLYTVHVFILQVLSLLVSLSTQHVEVTQ